MPLWLITTQWLNTKYAFLTWIFCVHLHYAKIAEINRVRFSAATVAEPKPCSASQKYLDHGNDVEAANGGSDGWSPTCDNIPASGPGVDGHEREMCRR